MTLVHGQAQPAPLVSRYLLGSALARLDDAGVDLVGSTQLTAWEAGRAHLRHVHSARASTLDVDAVVLAYGAEPRSELHTDLVARGVRTHLLGDAFAPRRLVFATRQAWDLAVTL